jgi:hypothetical protein
MGIEGWLVVTGGALFVQSPFGTGLLFYLHGAEPGRPRSVAKRPARNLGAGDKNGYAPVQGWLFWLFLCLIDLFFLFAIHTVGFLRSYAFPELYGCAMCCIEPESPLTVKEYRPHISPHAP